MQFPRDSAPLLILYAHEAGRQSAQGRRALSHDLLQLCPAVLQFLLHQFAAGDVAVDFENANRLPGFVALQNVLAGNHDGLPAF